MERFRGAIDAVRAVALLFGLVGSAATVGCGAAAGDKEAAQGRGSAAAAPAAAGHAGRRDPQFEDVTQKAGITSVHHKPDLDPKFGNIMNWLASVGAAVAAADYDVDGDIDLYVSDSRTGHPNHLYRNDGGFRFTDVAVPAGVARLNESSGTTMDAVFGDVDNDGYPDLYVVKWGCNVLFRNNGNGTFTDITRTAGVGDCGNGNAAVFVDYDLDGNLDLMVGNYFKNADLWHTGTTRIMHDSFESSRNAGQNLLYHNNGDGTFTDLAHGLGLDDTGWTLDLGCGDIDNDGDQDCYIANDFGDDKLFRNNANGTFSDITNPAEVFEGGWGWCGKFLDYDNDGDLDIFTVNGFVSADDGNYWYDLATMATTPDLDITDSRNWPMMGKRSFSGYEPSRLFRNDGPVFLDVAAREGITDTFDGRGIAVADLDGDGWLDLFVANQGERPALYRNRGVPGRHWIGFDLRQTGRNTGAIGARVTLRSGDLTQVREVDGGNGYASQSSAILHFGLDSAATVDEAMIRWPDGAVESLRNLRPDSVVRRVHPFRPR